MARASALPSPTALAHRVRYTGITVADLAREHNVSHAAITSRMRTGGFGSDGRRLVEEEHPRPRLKDSDNGYAGYVGGADRIISTEPARYEPGGERRPGFDWGDNGPEAASPSRRKGYAEPDPDEYAEPPLLPSERPDRPADTDLEFDDDAADLELEQPGGVGEREGEAPEPTPPTECISEIQTGNKDLVSSPSSRQPGKLAAHTQVIIDRYVSGESSTAIAKDFDCTPAAITALLHRNDVHVRTRAEGQRIAFGNPRASDPGNDDQKTCVRCEQTKQLTEFPEHKLNKATGRGGTCRDCLNKRPPTEARAIRNRARNRAYAELTARHHAEWEQLLEAKTVEVAAEFDRIRTAAGKDGDPVPRLKPGPRRKDQSDVIERIDVARCRTCHVHHDAKHVCPSCGDATPENQPSVPPYEMRAWAEYAGLAPVPRSGPLPKRIVNAYFDAHTQAEGVEVS